MAKISLFSSLIDNVKFNCMTIALTSCMSANSRKWSNTLKQFVSNSQRFFLSAFDHFVELVLKGLMIFWQFRTNAFFSSSYLVAYIWTLPPNRWSKWTYQCLRKWPYLKEKKTLWSLSHKLKINCIPIALLIFWQFREMLFFLFLKK